MKTKIQKWGNSQGIRFSKEILEKVHLIVGDEVEIVVQNKQTLVKAVSEKRKKYKLKDLIQQIPKDYNACEED